VHAAEEAVAEEFSPSEELFTSFFLDKIMTQPLHLVFVPKQQIK